MKTNIFFAAILLALFAPNVLAFDNQLPARFTCDAKLYCMSTDKKYQHEGWSFAGQERGYLKAGEYVFNRATMNGDPYDPFFKRVQVDYKMIDEKGFEYRASYMANDWLIPVHIENWYIDKEFAACYNQPVENCYVSVVTPPPPPEFLKKQNETRPT